MRVVQVNYAFDATLTSGDDLLQTYTTLTGWADALAHAGADVLTVQRFHSSANVTRMGLPYVLGDVGAIRAAIGAFQPDVVHVNGLEHAREGVRLSADSLTPSAPALVVQDHGSLAPSGVRGLVRRAFPRAVDAFLFTTRAQAEPWREAGLLAPHQRVYDVMEASTTLRALPGDAARAATGVTGDPAVVWIGRLNANKDPLTVLDGFERFARRRERATLTMLFQDGELLDRVRARIDNPWLTDRVRLVGVVSHERVAAFLSVADVFVAGSHHEGSGYALLEALACGATPAVTDIPPFRAMVSAGPAHIGCLWSVGDADACARAIDGASAHHDRARVIDHFARYLTWDAVGARAVAAYEDVLRTRTHAAL